MGMYSWITSDTNESISNVYSVKGALPVKLLDNEGNEYFEDAYEGYGVFGGVEFYDLVATLNGLNSRDDAISAAFGNEKLVLPKLVSADCTLTYDELPDSESCSAQGFFYEEMVGLN